MSIRTWAVRASMALSIMCVHAMQSNAKETYDFYTHNAKITLPQAANLDLKEQKDLICASLNVYHEARGSSIPNRIGVAWVVKNRMNIKKQSACDIVYARNAPRGQAQFSWTTRKHSKQLEKSSWLEAQEISFKVLFSSTSVDPTKGSTHFHELRIQPVWSNNSTHKIILGSHVFVKVSSYVHFSDRK